MGEVTGIAWTHHTFSAWEGCAKVSPGCKHCYAETRNERFHGGAHWGVDAPRLMRSESYWREPLKWAKAARAAGERRRVFCSSLADVFEDRPDLEAPRARLFSLIEETPELDWLLLTKRPENMHRLAPVGWRDGWPSHVWAGTTAENMEMLWERAPHLLRVPARVRFLSCEPLLEAVDVFPYLGGLFRCAGCESMQWAELDCPVGHCPPDEDGESSCSFVEVAINWVIVGGESGPKARPCAVEWIESIVRQCADAGVPCFVKQLGAMSVSVWRTAPADCFREPRDPTMRAPQRPDMDPRGEYWAWSAGLRSKAGADPSEWPEDLRVQEFPR